MEVETSSITIDDTESDEALLEVRKQLMSRLAVWRNEIAAGRWPLPESVDLSGLIDKANSIVANASYLEAALRDRIAALQQRVEHNVAIYTAMHTQVDTPAVTVENEPPIITWLATEDTREPLCNLFFDTTAASDEERIIFGLEQPHPVFARLVVGQDSTVGLARGLTSTGCCGDLRIACCWPRTANEGWCLHLFGQVVDTAGTTIGLGDWAAESGCRLHLLPVASQQAGRSSVSTWLAGDAFYQNAYDYIRTWKETFKTRVKTKGLFGSSKKTVKVTVEFEELYPDGRNVVEQPLVADCVVINSRHVAFRAAPLRVTTSSYAPWLACVLSLSSERWIAAADVSYGASLASALVGPLPARGSAAQSVGDRSYEHERSRFNPRALRQQLGIAFADARINPTSLVRPLGGTASVTKRLSPMLIEGSLPWPM